MGAAQVFGLNGRSAHKPHCLTGQLVISCRWYAEQSKHFSFMRSRGVALPDHTLALRNLNSDGTSSSAPFILGSSPAIYPERFSDLLFLMVSGEILDRLFIPAFRAVVSFIPKSPRVTYSTLVYACHLVLFVLRQVGKMSPRCRKVFCRVHVFEARRSKTLIGMYYD